MPKIVSVNKEFTENAHRVSFNLDSVPAAGVVEAVEYGVLNIWGEGDVLHVQAPEGGPEFSQQNLRTLQQKLDAAQTDFDSEVNRKDARLQRVAGNLGLPLA